MTIPLRPYQQSAHDSILREYRAGVRSTLVVMPTGSGKSRVIASIAEVATRPVLVLAHTRGLVNQLADGFRALRLNVGIEMGDFRIINKDGSLPRVVVASVQSMGKRLDSYPPDSFGLVVRDEAHRAVSDSKLLAHFATAKVLGVTATPDRTDGRPLGKVFDSVAYEYPIGDAIRDGVLCPLRMRSIMVDDLHLSDVRMLGKHDYDPDDLEKQLCVESALHAVAGPLLELAGNRPTIVFCATVRHARSLADVMGRYRHGAALAVAGEDKDADARIERFKRGEVQFLCNVALLTEGTDIPPIACVAMARPTKSRSLMVQAIGRGLRLHPGKADCLALDFTGADDAPDLRSPADALGGSLDPAVTQAVRKAAAEVDVEIQAALAAAENFVAEEVRRDLITQATYRELDPSSLSPFQILRVTTPAGRYAGAPAGPALVQALKDAGLRVKDCAKLDRGQAETLLEALASRRRKGLCTVKVARWLIRFGLNPDVDSAAGRDAMTAFAAAEWRFCPASIRSDPRFAA